MGDVKDWDKTASSVGNGSGRFFRRFAILVLVLVVIGVIGLVGFRVLAVDKVDYHEFAYRWDLLDGGKVTPITRIGDDGKPLDRSGYVITWPIITKVHTIDLRPMQVCISAIQRVLNCKLVQFTPTGIGVDDDGKSTDGFRLLLKWHGRANYTNDGGTRENPTIFNQILMAYAYEGSGHHYPFLRIIRELKPEEVEEAKR